MTDRPLHPITATHPVHLTQAQKMIWAGDQIDPSARVFNTAWRFDIHAAVDPNRFQVALDTVVSAIDALRLVLSPDPSGEPTLYDSGHAAGTHEVLELTEGTVQPWLDDALTRDFDLTQHSFHSALIRLGDAHWIWYFNQHHMMTDANSGALIFDALSQAYAGELVPDRGRFLEHARNEPERINTENAKHWQDAAAQNFGLPRLYGRSIDGTKANAVMETVKLDATRMATLDDLLTQQGFAALSRPMALHNLFSTVLAAWVHRVTNEYTVPLGVVTHGRGTSTARRIAGCFIELFPLRIDIPDNTTFRNLHQSVAQTSFDMLRRATPGASAARGLSRFNVVLNLLLAEFPSWTGNPVDVTWLDSKRIDQHHAFRLNLLQSGPDGAISLAMAFNTSLFDENLRHAAKRHLLTLLDGMLANPDQPIGAVGLAHDTDASAALTRTRFPDVAPVEDVLAQAEVLASDAPDAVAILQDGQEITRVALMDRVSSIAHALAERGVIQGDRVGLFLTRSTDLVAAMLAVLKLGASFVPLDPGQSDARLAQIADLAALRLTVTEPVLLQRWVGPTVVTTTISAVSAEALPRVTNPAPAYVMFTSGSTGQPKGVVISRNALSRYASWANDSFADGLASTWALHSAIGFDLTLTSIFAPLVTGGVIRIYPDTLTAPNLSVLDVVRESSVDVVKLTPAHLRLAIEAGVQPGRIRALVLGGEALPSDLCRSALQAFGPNLKIFNEYGPTEATVGCMIHQFDPDPDTDTDRDVPIGRPARDTSIYVLDDALNPAADFVQGELFVAGPDRLADGYLDQPEATEAAFVDNLFAQGRMYKTGDRASVCPDGTILYHGRADDQVKISGVRIEPAEIENATGLVPGVEHCAVVAMDLDTLNSMLCRTCGAPRVLPHTRFAEPDLCQTCADFEGYEARVADYFGDLDELRTILDDRAGQSSGAYDCVMLLSGGKDSTYALSRLSELTSRILSVTLDNGFISDGAKENIKTITERLGIDHRFISTSAMNDIFVDSLKRHANVCNGCFKTIYTLALHLAREVGAPTIVTGLSRGQLFETRLAPELFDQNPRSRTAIDDMVMSARRSYHAFPDVVASRLNKGLFDQGDVLSEVAFVDFYRYCDVPVSEVYRHLEGSVGWSRPMDTGRSTNCLINDVGIHLHKARRGYHNYAQPYGWDVRLGHKTRDEAVNELQDDIDTTRVGEILDEIGFDEPTDHGATTGPHLVLYYVSAQGITAQDIRRELLGRLPREMVPQQIIPVSEIPLTVNGKTDTNALPMPDFATLAHEVAGLPDDSALTPTEAKLIDIWRQVLGQPAIRADSNYYDVGGDSLAAIRIATQAAKAGFSLSAQDIFRHQSVSQLARVVEAQRPVVSTRPMPPRRAISTKDKARLAALFGKKSDG